MIAGVVLTDAAKGGTFLSWSLYYLSGRNDYYLAKEQKCHPLIDNPITNKNAHLFHPNMPARFDEYTKIFNLLDNCNTQEIIYFHDFWDDIPSQSDSKRKTTTRDAIIDIQKHNIKTIAVVHQQTNSLYDCKLERRVSNPSYYNINSRRLNSQEQLDDFIDYYFSKDKTAWQNMGLTDIWDRREFLALNVKNDNDSIIHEHIISSKLNCYLLDSFDLYNYFDKIVFDVFKYLNIKIDSTRLEHWHTVYHSWRELHRDRVQFSWYFNIIIKNILSGLDMDLTRFNLDILREAAIQRELLYNHNLALKTYGVEKFLNTKQLHELLEPNVYHKLENIN